MDITEFVKPQGEFLKPDVVKKYPEGMFEIVAEAKIVENNFNNLRLHIPVKINDESFVFDCSKTNARTIAEKLGNETKSWIGKLLELEVYKTKTSDGKLTEAINVKNIS